METKQRRNNSTLAYADCIMRLTGTDAFEAMSIDDLDSIYGAAFGHWAYHLIREGYIKALYEKRAELRKTYVP